jgi:alkyl hydroperoxide reductase subunit AhpC
VKVIGLSVDSVGDHKEWVKDIEETQGTAVNYPLIADHDLKVAKAYGMLHPNAGDKAEGRKAADNATVRTVFIIGPDKNVKAHFAYPMSTGRNFDEILRTIDSIQLTAKHKVATPAQWKPGGDVVIIPFGRRGRGAPALPERLEGAQAVPAHREGTRLARTCATPATPSSGSSRTCWS